jgi:hypothetical protein
MKLKKLYTHNNKKQIWRILPTTNEKLVIEEREVKTKEVFFSCLEINSGKKLFNEFQFDEKNWIGIESIYKDIIFFHAYRKPDMPAHKSIIAFNIHSKSVLWQNDDYVFSFINDDKVFCYQQRFESRIFIAFDCLTGNIVDDFGTDAAKLQPLREEADGEFEKQNYLFPEYFKRNNAVIEEFQKHLQQFLTDNVIKGEISYLRTANLLMYNYHQVSKNNTLNNIFVVFDLSKNKILLKETLDKNLVNLMPESFFVKDNFLFLIIDKTKLFVYQIKV